MSTHVELYGKHGSRTIAIKRDDRFTNARFGKVAPAPTEPLRVTPDLPTSNSPQDATAAVVAATVNPEPTTDLKVSPAVTAVEAPEPTTVTPPATVIEPSAMPPEFTTDALVEIVEKMTALDVKDGSKTEGWHCEASIFKVSRINLKHNVTSPVLREMLFELTTRGILEHKRQWRLNKFRLTPTQPLVELLAEVDTLMTEIEADNDEQRTGLGERYGIAFSALATFTEASKHLDADALVKEHGDWLLDCVWAFPTDSFWVEWRESKEALKATGYETLKLDGIWVVYSWGAKS